VGLVDDSLAGEQFHRFSSSLFQCARYRENYLHDEKRTSKMGGFVVSQGAEIK
jgi:hypothetical protein